MGIAYYVRVVGEGGDVSAVVAGEGSRGLKERAR